MNLLGKMKSMNYSNLIGAFLISLILAISALAQESRVKPQEGRLVGQLRDLCKVGINNAVIRIKGGNVKRKIKSNAEGKFEVYLPVGTYNVTVEKYGFKRYTMDDIRVMTTLDATVNLDMQPGYSTGDPNSDKPLKPCPPPNNSFNASGISGAFIRET